MTGTGGRDGFAMYIRVSGAIIRRAGHPFTRGRLAVRPDVTEARWSCITPRATGASGVIPPLIAKRMPTPDARNPAQIRGSTRRRVRGLEPWLHHMELGRRHGRSTV